MQYRKIGYWFLATFFSCLVAPNALSQTLEVRSKPRFYPRVVCLCVGIEKYGFEGLRDTPFSEEDAKAIAELFRSKYGFETHALLGSDATLSGIMNKLTALTETLAENDCFIFFFAGHGQVVQRQQYGEAGFLVPYGAEVSLSDTLAYGKWSTSALDMIKLRELLETIPCRHVLALIDACCSGFMTERGSNLARVELRQVLQWRSRAVISATTKRQVATPDVGARHGYFTNALLTSLGSRDAASATDVFQEVRETVAASTYGAMTPQMSPFGENIGEFVFIPLSIPEETVAIAFRGDQQRQQENSVSSALHTVAARNRALTKPEDVFLAFESFGYALSMNPAQEDIRWHRILARFEENAAISDPLALAGMHYCYSKGLGCDVSNSRAYDAARLAYATGHVAGLHCMGRCLLEGIGIEKNVPAGVRMIEAAAEKGFPISQYFMSYHELDSDPNAAFEWAKQAADAGLLKGKHRFARMLASDELGAKSDPQRALKLFHELAALGDAESQYVLYTVYADDKWVPTDRKRATELLRKAASAGFPIACYDLAIELGNIPGTGARLGLKKDPVKCFALASSLAEQGDLDAKYLVASMYQYGFEPVVSQNMASARKILQELTDAGFEPARKKLSTLPQ